MAKKSEFSSILEKSKKITDLVYEDPLNYQTSDVITLFESAKIPEQKLRDFVEQHLMSPDDWQGESNNILCNLSDWSSFAQKDYESSLTDLFAIDATDSPVISVMVGQFYEVVVGGISYTMDGNLQPEIYRASAVLKNLSEKDESLAGLVEEISKQDRSWPNTFREYKEREYALTCKSNHVIVDGPILTQNLITQKDGEKLTSDLLASNKKVVGVIKNLGASTGEERWIGRVLKEGEAFVITDCKNLLQNRNKSWANSKGKSLWMNKVASKYCRGVYRPGNDRTGKSSYFGFECRIDHLPWALAVLYNERSEIPGHEIPFLLDHIDARLDAIHDRSSVKARLEAVLMEYNPEQAFDSLDNDDFRGK